MKLDFSKLPPLDFVMEFGREDTPYEGNVSAIDDETDKENERWVEEQLARGNDWAWCYVVAHVQWKTFHATASLSCCSYENKQQFIDAGTWDELKDEARAELERLLTASADALEELHARPAEGWGYENDPMRF